MTSESLVNMPSIFSHSVTNGKGNLFNGKKFIQISRKHIFLYKFNINNNINI